MDNTEIRIGISGWRYAPWRGTFYPQGLRQKDELHFASRTVNSIEINGTFYALQKPERFAGWAATAPDDFKFSVKAPGFITHTRRLRSIERPLANFFASGVFHLKSKLGPILWQLPPSFKYDAELLEDFLTQLPRTTSEAKSCIQGCDKNLQQPGYLDVPARLHLRHALEIRHTSFVDEKFIAQLHKHKVALVVADTAGKWPYLEELTSDFIYLRLHGDKELYSSGYSNKALNRWVERIQTWHRGEQVADAHLVSVKAKSGKTTTNATAAHERAIYCYFDNDVKVRAPFDARQLLKKLDLDHSLEIGLNDKPGVAL
jgi:uncharacterized protein YecE (DUF72 family)